MIYIPMYAPEIMIQYSAINPELSEIEIKKLLVNGEGISEYLQSHLLDNHEADWEHEIIETLNKRRQMK